MTDNKKPITKDDAQRMQSGFDKSGKNQEAKARVMSASEKNTQNAPKTTSKDSKAGR